MLLLLLVLGEFSEKPSPKWSPPPLGCGFTPPTPARSWYESMLVPVRKLKLIHPNQRAWRKTHNNVEKCSIIAMDSGGGGGDFIHKHPSTIPKQSQSKQNKSTGLSFLKWRDRKQRINFSIMARRSIRDNEVVFLMMGMRMHLRLIIRSGNWVQVILHVKKQTNKSCVWNRTRDLWGDALTRYPKAALARETESA